MHDQSHDQIHDQIYIQNQDAIQDMASDLSQVRTRACNAQYGNEFSMKPFMSGAGFKSSPDMWMNGGVIGY